MPPWIAATWPSSEVPVPKGTTGAPCWAASRMMAATSAVDWAKATASGGRVA